MGIKRERIATFNVQRPVNWDEKAVQKIIDRDGFVYVDLKYDGIRGVIFYDVLEGAWRAVTRENIEIQSIATRVDELLEHSGCPKDAVLDCEVVINGIPFDKASGLLRSYTPLADEYHLTLYVFDALNLADLTMASRSVQVAYRKDYVRHNDVLTCARRQVAKDLGDVYALFEDARERGFEGLVVKDPSQKYTGSKVKGWFKLKPKETADGKVIGFVEGTAGKANEGKKVGFIVRLEDGTTCNATGLNQVLIDHVTRDPDLFMGAYVEIERMESTGEGNSRHPHFKCFRDLESAKGIKS